MPKIRVGEYDVEVTLEEFEALLRRGVLHRRNKLIVEHEVPPPPPPTYGATGPPSGQRDDARKYPRPTEVKDYIWSLANQGRAVTLKDLLLQFYGHDFDRHRDEKSDVMYHRMIDYGRYARAWIDKHNPPGRWVSVGSGGGPNVQWKWEPTGKEAPPK